MSRREAAIGICLGLAAAGSVAFMAAYAAKASAQIEGLALFAALGGFFFATLGYARWIVGEARAQDARDTYPSASADRSGAVGNLEKAERTLSRGGVLTNLLLGALALFGLATLFPLRSLGPAPDGALFKTKWRRGSGLTREDGSVVRASDLEVDSVATVFPENAVGDAASQAMLIRIPSDLGPSVDGYVAYSKVCTHAGCPVALYRAATHQLLCPCHQSVFDVLHSGAVLSGPADHALPQLPIHVDADGVLRATGDFPVPIGPGFWERG
ncbi:MAG TPA: Rieske (2Fe-2S) protein [Candidatus Tumulicola sp.]|jgi:ubiquinol-cytochrome c reductase iron-sulfur subunit